MFHAVWILKPQFKIKIYNYLKWQIPEMGFTLYCIYTKYWDRPTWANNADPDQMPQGLHCLSLIQHTNR